MIDPTVLAAIISGSVAVIVVSLTQVFRVQNSKNPPPATIAPSTSAEIWTVLLNQGEKIKNLRAEIVTVRSELAEEKVTSSDYRAAASRYFELLSLAWPGPGVMPDPAEADRTILGVTLPRARTRRKKETT